MSYTPSARPTGCQATMIRETASTLFVSCAHECHCCRTGTRPAACSAGMCPRSFVHVRGHGIAAASQRWALGAGLEAVDTRQARRVGHEDVLEADVSVLHAAQRDLVLDLAGLESRRALAHDEGIDLLCAQVARPHYHHIWRPPSGLATQQKARMRAPSTALRAACQRLRCSCWPGRATAGPGWGSDGQHDPPAKVALPIHLLLPFSTQPPSTCACKLW